MDFVFYVPVGLILAFVICILGGAYGLLQSLTEILFKIFSGTFFILGIIIVIGGIWKAQEKKRFVYGVAETIRGIFVSFSTFLIEYFLDIGSGTRLFNDAEFTLLGKFETLDNYTATLLITAIIFLIVSLPTLLAKRKYKLVYPVLTICLVLASCIGIYGIGMNSAFNNSYDAMNWDSPEYEVTETTAIKQQEFIFSPITTGQFKAGTKLYTNGGSRSFDDTEYYLVTDGKKVGYVSSESVKSLVTYIYEVNADSELYGFEEQDYTYYAFGEKKEATKFVPTDEVVGSVEKGTTVTIQYTYSVDIFEPLQYLIQLPDGTEGFIDIDKITEIRE